ncbi:MAG: hypothetical protein IPN34_03490 [Planctomycetes bacterium]|nr:hypothetical protein [Planctomycetota bacterium]
MHSRSSALLSLLLGAAPLAAQDPSSAATLAEAIDAAQRAELLARTQHATTEGFQAWRKEFGMRMGELAQRWAAKANEAEDLFALARLWAYAQRWENVDEVLTRYLALPAMKPFVARCERVRARAAAGRGAGAREDLLWLLEKEPQRFDLALFLYGLPALVEPAGRALGQRALQHLEKRYQGDAYAPICAALAQHLAGLGASFPRPAELGRTGAAQPAGTAPLRLLFFFRSSAPLTRAPLPFLKGLGARFSSRGLAIELAAPREGARFWERFRPSSPQPTVGDEVAALGALTRALELPFAAALLGEASVLEERHALRVLPHFVLLDEQGRALLFACGGEGYEWLELAIERLLDPQQGAALRAAYAAR